MPQGHRKAPFTGKAKKLQMKEKRDRQRTRVAEEDPPDQDAQRPGRTGDAPRSAASVVTGCHQTDDRILDAAISGLGTGKSKRFDLRFQTETKGEIEEVARKAREPLGPVLKRGDPNWLLEAKVEDFFPADKAELDFPRRPEWRSKSSKDELERNEARHFKEYVDRIFRSNSAEQANLGYFELNLETWRQLWRVVEKSDVLLLMVDARYPAAMFPPSLYKAFVSSARNRRMILVLNKVDLIEPGLAVAWKHYFEAAYPGLKVVYFTSLTDYNLTSGNREGSQGEAVKKKLKGRISMAKEGALMILDAISEVMKDDGSLDEVKASSLSSWRRKIEAKTGGGRAEEQTGCEPLKSHDQVDDAPVLTIGMVGQPNSGKSSLINALMGKKVVSVSKTPGHTKHFQTIFMTRTVVLCDCPGLVFPSLVPRPLQILMGSYPISQVRQPLGTVRFLAERLDLEQVLNLGLGTHSSGDDGDDPLRRRRTSSTYDICEKWAERRGFTTARSNRPDVHRAANHILRMALDGRTIALRLQPPGHSPEEWRDHPDVGMVYHVLGRTVGAGTIGKRLNCDDFPDDDGDEDVQEDDDADSDDNLGQGHGAELAEEEAIASSNKFDLLDLENA